MTICDMPTPSTLLRVPELVTAIAREIAQLTGGDVGELRVAWRREVPAAILRGDLHALTPFLLTPLDPRAIYAPLAAAAGLVPADAANDWLRRIGLSVRVRQPEAVPMEIAPDEPAPAGAPPSPPAYECWPDTTELVEALAPALDGKLTSGGLSNTLGDVLRRPNLAAYRISIDGVFRWEPIGVISWLVERQYISTMAFGFDVLARTLPRFAPTAAVASIPSEAVTALADSVGPDWCRIPTVDRVSNC